MDELTARLQRAATEVAEPAVVPAPDDIVRRGRRQRRRHAAGAVLLAMALAGGAVAVPLLRPWQPAAPTPSTSTLAPGQGCPARVTTAQLTARNIAFDPACLAAVTGKPFQGEVFRGPRTVAYRVPALRAGRYFFRCDIHPTAMQGQLIIR